MALLACYECDNAVSSCADACPKCGAPFEPNEPAIPQGSSGIRRNLVQSSDPQSHQHDRWSPKARRAVVGGAFVVLGGLCSGAGFLDSGYAALSIVIGVLILMPLRPKRPPRNLRPKVVCKFCNEAGHVTVTPAERKRGISGSKATGALLTGGLSLLAVGLSRKDVVSAMHCHKCSMQWDE